MLRVVKKMWGKLRENLWESCEKVFHVLEFCGFSFENCVKVEKFSRSISTVFRSGFSLLGGEFYTIST